MKKALIIVLSLLLTLNVALLAYGATLGDEITAGTADLGDLVPPENPREYAHAFAEWAMLRRQQGTRVDRSREDAGFLIEETDGWFDVFGKSDSSASVLMRCDGAALVANLMVPITYNHNRVKQYREVSHFEITAGGRRIYSDNIRIRQQVAPAQMDRFYLSLAWTGMKLSSFATLRAGYNDQAFVSRLNLIQAYDEESGTYRYQLRAPTTSSRNRDPDEEIPYKTFGLLSLPIYFGDLEIDASVVDDSSVKINEPTAETPYYVLSFSEDLTAAQKDENVNRRLNRALGDQMSNAVIKQADFRVEIWDSGVFRQIRAHFLVNAKIGGKQGDAEVDMSYKFYYDDASCDIVDHFESVGWEKYLNAANRAEFDQKKKGKTIS